jgi:transposase
MSSAHAKMLCDKDEKIATLERQVESLKHQLDWFQRQLFGRKSEKRRVEDLPEQPLLDGLQVHKPSTNLAAETETIAYTRAKRRGDDCMTDTGLRFAESVPVKTIEIPAPELAGPDADAYEVISEKITYRLAQAKSSYQILKYVRPVLKHRPSQALSSPPAPPALWEGSIADVSVVAGMLVEKLVYHMPLYRQHQRLIRDGIELSRQTLSNWVHRAIMLLEPIFDAQLAHILCSKHLAIDETPVKAGRGKPGKMKLGWYWPIYGEDDEVAFTFSPSRGHQHLLEVLGEFAGTLLTDGYGAYSRYVQRCEDIEHAQCWSHCRREFLKAEKSEPEAVAQALDIIGVLYQNETVIRNDAGIDKLTYRQSHSTEAVDRFFNWCEGQCERIDLVPSAPLSKALKYARKREANLRVFLNDALVQIDTNHLERTLRVIPMGKKAWLFSWTELGAKQIGIAQSLLSTCRLHQVDPYTYLIDVLQRVSEHPAADVEQLTPRLWKQYFAHAPLRSDLDAALPA